MRENCPRPPGLIRLSSKAFVKRALENLNVPIELQRRVFSGSLKEAWEWNEWNGNIWKKQWGHSFFFLGARIFLHQKTESGTVKQK
jgi:hypothetical protein